MDIEDIGHQVFIEKVGKFEDILKLQAMPEFKTLVFYFKMIADNALRELTTVPDLTLERQCELKMIIKICKYDFANLPLWLKGQAKLAEEVLQERIDDGSFELKDLT